MIKLIKKYTFLTIVITLFTFFIACANMAAPGGGDYDLDPPVVMSSKPKFNEVNFKNNKVEIVFNENVVLDKPNEKVIITPPQSNLPKITAVNRKVTVELKDTLLPNTTYTVDFTDAIQDNNENNPLENFSISFSTGDIIDSLQISGKVLTADNLEPVKGLYVGIHSNLEDSAFTSTKFLRISRTNDYGAFTIRGIAPGTYRVYALDDQNRDYMYDNPNEALAFLDSLVVPTSMPDMHMDTIFSKLDTAKIDTIVPHHFTRFLPDNLVLRSFQSKFQRQYLQSHTRDAHKLNIYMGGATDMIAEVEPINFDSSKDWSVFERNITNDTLTYWIKDHAINEMDSLVLGVTYLWTDSLNFNIPVTDTLLFVDRGREKARKERQKLEEKAKKEGKELPVELMNITSNLSSSWDIFRNITFEFSAPIISDSLEHKIRLSQKKDSLFNDISYQLSIDSLNPRKYTIKHKWAYGQEYKVDIDSASIKNIYGLWNDKFSQNFTVKKEDQYGKLLVRVTGVPENMPAFIELLDKSDKPKRKSRVRDNEAVFLNLDPGDYYMRIIFDENDNGVWDTGEYHEKRQPEMVCYYNSYITLRAFGEIIQDWAVSTDNLDKQKPLDITKNKPQKKETKREQLEREERERNEKDDKNRRGTQDQYGNPNGQYQDGIGSGSRDPYFGGGTYY